MVTRGFNDDQVEELAALTLTSLGTSASSSTCRSGATSVYMRTVRPGRRGETRLVRRFGALEELEWSGIAASRDFRLPGAKGTVGLITPMTEHFCAGCNRLRLTADGKVRPCLLTEIETDILGPLRSGISDEELLQLLGVASS